MFTISKEFSFSASHVLAGLPAEHPCGRTHGHNYVVTVELVAEGELDAVGFVRDYRALDPVKKWIDETVDHRHLNDVMDGVNPTAESISRWVFERWQKDLPELTAVRVSETPKTWAEYRPNPVR
ncbi:MAG TPA: 6-carboxytetrahydropterin synthase [Actinoplanes sp.]|nr:6-carboxytetrahydropterin synthase [Actinoplanes sp.]